MLGLGVIVANTLLKRTAYRVREVIDGDTVVTTENQMIRIADIDAPELGKCKSDEAKTFLTKLVINQPVFLKIRYRDKFNRLVADTYTKEGSVGTRILEAGLAVWSRYDNKSNPEMKSVFEKARENKLGIFSETCTQQENKSQPTCQIKANNREGVKQYRFPGCGQYQATLVQLWAGDEWFCTEKEAVAAGYNKGQDCFGKSWK